MNNRPLEDWEYPDPDDDENLDESETLECPACGEAVYEDAEQCPYCGEFIAPGSASVLDGRPWWYVALAILGIVAVIAVMTNLWLSPSRDWNWPRVPRHAPAPRLRGTSV